MAGRTWRAEARAALIAYPELKAELAERQQMKITAEYSLAPRAGPGRRGPWSGRPCGSCRKKSS